ncbi:type VII secretion protein EccE [Mycolicibacterium sp. BiH015]|uniref:type VII secretion protein EccE n=1 Tax=Mycolicibacterium sp. BiH015 TaxID=3018808 RepID=UPI0022E81322|nr:type VII secretion protein EccE [Mycolicibacterium sp. BiH015]MDA2891421.1 type VII secretion protein EccE [Mycolicibacterium sp. BiH015]
MTVRLTLAALFVVPAAMAYPWQTTADRWLLGVSVVAVVILFAWWRGLFVTTMIGRRIAMLTGRSDTGLRPGEYATVTLRVDPGETAELPLDLLAGYLDRYGIDFDKVRVLSRDIGTARTTWIAVTLGAADNVAALTARSARLPLQDTAELSARRLADHLRELGWDVSLDEAPAAPVTGTPKESWRGVDDGGGYVAAYRVTVDDQLTEALDAARTSGAQEVWTAVEFTGSRTQPEIAAACALRTAERPTARAPLPKLTPERGRHRAALSALAPSSERRLAAHPVRADHQTLGQLRWPVGAVLSRT